MNGVGWAWTATGRAGFAARLALFYGALFVIYGVQVPYLPVWLDWQGLSAREIAVVTATPYLLRLLVTPSVALVADRLGNHRIMVIELAWVALALALLLAAMTGFWPLFLAAVPFAIVVNTMLPLTETIAVGGVIAHGLDYGRMRLWGSLTFIAIGLLGGTLVDSVGAGVAIWLIIAGALLTVAAGHYLPLPTPEEDTASRPHPKLAVAAARRLVAHPLFLVFLLAAGSIQAAHAMFYAFGALNWRAQGLSTTWVGVLWAVAVLSEVVLFAYSGAVVRRVGAAGLLVWRGGGRHRALGRDGVRAAARRPRAAPGAARGDLRRLPPRRDALHRARSPRGRGRDGAGALCHGGRGRDDGSRDDGLGLSLRGLRRTAPTSPWRRWAPSGSPPPPSCCAAGTAARSGLRIAKDIF